jgi:ABC-type sugar transport system ATPase subunit
MAADGMAIIVISSELDEVLGLAHRILVMRHGHFTAELEGEAMNEQNVLAAAFSEARMG